MCIIIDMLKCQWFPDTMDAACARLADMHKNSTYSLLEWDIMFLKVSTKLICKTNRPINAITGA